MSAPNRVAGDECDHDLGHGTDQLLQIENIKPWHAVFAHIARVAADRLVAPGAERVLAVSVWAGSRQEHHANGLVLTSVGKGIIELKHRLRAERVPLFRPVDGDLRDAIGLVIKDVGVGRLGDLPGG
jgi:hypothetical protein